MFTRFTCFCFLLMLCLSLNADPIWDEPLCLTDGSNIVLSKHSLQTSDEGIVILWNQTGNLNGSCHVQKYNSDMQPLWPQPFVFSYDHTILGIIETSEQNILIAFKKIQEGYGAVLLSQDGVLVWMNGEDIAPACFSWTESLIVSHLFPDQAGGAICVLNRETEIQYADVATRVFHIHSDGTRDDLTPMINPEGYPNMSYQLLRDGGILTALSLGLEIRLTRFNHNSEPVWTKVISYSYPPQYRISALSDGSFYLLCKQYDCVEVMLFDERGEQCWADVVLISNIPSSDEYFRIGKYDLTVTSENDIVFTWLIAGSAFAFRISTLGLVLFSNIQPLISNTSPFNVVIDADYNNGVFVTVGSSDFYQNEIHYAYNIQYLDHLNTTWDQSVIIPYNNVNCYFESSHVFAGENVKLLYTDSIVGENGIYYQVISPQGDLAYPISGYEVMSGGFSLVTSTTMTAGENSVFVLWGQVDITYLPHKWKYQLVSYTDQSFSSPIFNLFQTEPDRAISDIKIIYASHGQFFVTWLEGSGPYTLKAQLISAAGEKLWEPDGRIVTQNTQTDYQTDNHNGELFLVWRIQNIIYGQKYWFGNPQWGPYGHMLVSNTGVNYNYYNRICALGKRYLVYEFNTNAEDLPRSVKVLRFDSNGYAEPGWEVYGIAATDYNDTYIRLTYLNCVTSDYGIALSFLYQYIAVANPQSFVLGQLISPQGTRLWGIYGFYNFIYIPRAISAGLVYTFGNQFSLRVFDFNGVEVYQGSLPYQWGYTVISNQLVKLPEDTFILAVTYIGDIYSDYNLAFVKFNSLGELSYLDDVYTLNIQVPSPMKFSVWGRNFLVNWNGLDLSYYGFIGPFIQGISLSPSTSIEEEYIPPQIHNISNAPNPFKENTELVITLDEILHCDVNIYNLRGQKVRTLHSGQLDKGKNSLMWDGKDDNGTQTCSGIYFCRQSSVSGSKIHKMLKVK